MESQVESEVEYETPELINSSSQLLMESELESETTHLLMESQSESEEESETPKLFDSSSQLLVESEMEYKGESETP